MPLVLAAVLVLGRVPAAWRERLHTKSWQQCVVDWFPFKNVYSLVCARVGVTLLVAPVVRLLPRFAVYPFLQFRPYYKLVYKPVGLIVQGKRTFRA